MALRPTCGGASAVFAAESSSGTAASAGRAESFACFCTRTQSAAASSRGRCGCAQMHGTQGSLTRRHGQCTAQLWSKCSREEQEIQRPELEALVAAPVAASSYALTRRGNRMRDIWADAAHEARGPGSGYHSFGVLGDVGRLWRAGVP